MIAGQYGLVTFYSWNHAVRAEQVLKRNEFSIDLIPAPREFTSNCGTALRFVWLERDAVEQSLESAHVPVEAIHEFSIDEVEDIDANGVDRSLGQRLTSWLKGAGYEAK